MKDTEEETDKEKKKGKKRQDLNPQPLVHKACAPTTTSRLILPQILFNIPDIQFDPLAQIAIKEKCLIGLS